MNVITDASNLRLRNQASMSMDRISTSSTAEAAPIMVYRSESSASSLSSVAVNPPTAMLK